jgi:three-Cys-motif partner protein
MLALILTGRNASATVWVEMSVCLHCGSPLRESLEEPWCPKCGIRFATKATPKKHEYLEAVCTTNKYDLVIDACAGSGRVQYSDGKLGEGSPLILKRLVKNGRCVCIEYDTKTYGLLTFFVRDVELRHGDCNEILQEYVDGEQPTLVFIDPNGYGVPAIRNDVVRKIASTKNTDLLVTFSWRICREIGHAARYLFCKKDNCPSPSNIGKRFASCDDCTNRKVAIAYKKSLDVWWGHSDWLKWGSIGARGYVDKYASPLRNGNTVETMPFSGGEQKYYKNDFYLILATKFNLPKYGILKWFVTEPKGV